MPSPVYAEDMPGAAQAWCLPHPLSILFSVKSHGAFAFEEDTPVWAELPPKEAAYGAELQASAGHLAGPPWLHVVGQTTRFSAASSASRA